MTGAIPLAASPENAPSARVKFPSIQPLHPVLILSFNSTGKNILADTSALMNTPSPVLELLESKYAPAGVVTATIAAGVLTLTGDLADNNITITEVAPDRFLVTGLDGTQIKLGTADPVETLDFDALQSIRIDMKEGADVVSLTGVSLSKDLSVVQGIGSNTTVLDGVSIGGALSVTGQSGADVVNILSSLTVGGNATFQLGDGANTVNESASIISIGGALNYTGGTATDSLNLSPSGPLSLGSVKIALGINSGSVVLSSQAQLTVAGEVNFESKDHAAGLVSLSMSATDTLFIGGKLTVKNGLGDNVVNISAGDGITIGQAVSITNGNASTASIFAMTSNQIALEAGLLVVNGTGGFTTVLSGSLDVTGNIAITNGNSGSATSTTALSGEKIDVSGGITVTNGTGTYSTSVTASDLNVAKVIAFSTKASSGSATTSNIVGATTLTAEGVSITNGGGRFQNSISATDGQIIKDLKLTNGDATGTVLNAVNSLPFIGGSLIIQNGNGNFNNTLSYDALYIGRDLSVTNGNSATTTQNLFNGNFLDVDGRLVITNKDGNMVNDINGNRIDVKGAMTITNGSTSGTTANKVSTGISLRVGGDLTFDNKNGIFTHDIGGATGPAINIGGNLTMKNGSQSSGTSQFLMNSGTTWIGKNAAFTSASGSTSVTLFATTSLVVRGTVGFTSKAGDDSLQLQSYSVLTTGAITTNMDNGRAEVNIGSTNATTINGAIKHSSGAGDDVLRIFGPGRVTGAVDANFGISNTSEFTLDSQSARFLATGGVSVIVINGVGSSANYLLRNLKIQGNVGIVSSSAGGEAELGIYNSSVVGIFGTALGSANDTLIISDSLFTKAVTISTGAGADNITIETTPTGYSSTFLDRVSLLMGDGADTLSISGASVERPTVFVSGFMLDGGTGADTYNPGSNVLGTGTVFNIP